jgi:hypothetical protein
VELVAVFEGGEVGQHRIAGADSNRAELIRKPRAGRASAVSKIQRKKSEKKNRETRPHVRPKSLLNDPPVDQLRASKDEMGV